MCEPIDYKNIVTEKNEEIRIGCCHDICQGGPVVGRLFIAEDLVFPNLYFGGPFLEKNKYLYIPQRKKNIFFNGFILIKINLVTHKSTKLNVKSEVINLKYIDGKYLYFSRSFFGDEVIENIKI